MSNWSPPSVPRNWLVVIGAGYALLVAYSLLVVQQVLLGVVVPAVLFVSVYLTWRFLAAVEAIADALQRIAEQRERD
jgi:membrane protein implicated in regulation of membrane protease activity